MKTLLWPAAWMAAVALAAAAPGARAQTQAVPRAASAPAPARMDDALRAQAETAIRKGLDWLRRNQRENGSWSNAKHPALTALPLWAFVRSDDPERGAVTEKAKNFILTFVRDDGGIYHKTLITGGLSTYNTAICMTALHAMHDPALAPVVLKARKFLASCQRLGDDDDETSGGFGYSRTTHFVNADLQNTVAAMEAMRLTADTEDLRETGQARVDIDWQKAVKFIARLQNGPDTGPEYAGGMTYRPGNSIAGSDVTPKGTVALRSTGSMTYAGLLSLVYADLSRDDPRVRSALQWALRHWTLNENPGVGDSGLYFFYNVMSRALDAYGQNRLMPEKGETIDWRAEYIRKVTSLQKTDDGGKTGYWVNDKSNRFWEGDAVLVTAYALLGLESALGR